MSSNNIKINDCGGWELSDAKTDELIQWLNEYALSSPEPQLLAVLGFPVRTTRKQPASKVELEKPAILKEDGMKYATICKKVEDNKRIKELLDKAIATFAEDYKRIWEAFPDAGLGDTACAKAVIKQIYEAIHYKL